MHVAGIPAAYYFGQEGLHSILVIDLLGPSLEDLFDMCSRKFSIKTVAMLAKQMVIYILYSFFLLTPFRLHVYNRYMSATSFTVISSQITF